MLMILFFIIKAEEKIVDAVKWALVAFEALSGIKINYDKTEIISMNLSPQEAHLLTTLIGCKVFSFSIKYLGVLLHDRKLRIND
jgi:hypothetical protein